MDDITLALNAIRAELLQLDHPRRLDDDGTSFTVYNRETGLCCPDGAGLMPDAATAEAVRMNREYDAMISLVRAYVDGDISSYAVRPTRGEVTTVA